MLFGFASLIALLVIWFDRKGVSPAAVSTPRGRSALVADALALLVILAAYFPLYSLLQAWAGLPGYLPGDARTHAPVAQQLYGEALLTGWTDRYVGGFPLALHYPIVGWLVIGLPMKLGVDSTSAVTVTCTVVLMSTSYVAYALARYNDARVMPSAVAALVLGWASPLNSFVGGYETFFMSGLVSQVMVMPLLLAWLALSLGRGSAAAAACFAALAFLTHPQVAIAAAVVLGLCVASMARRDLVMRALLSTGFALLVAGMVYGPAVIDFAVPFGWPQSFPWMRLGFGPDRLHAWLIDGDLLDNRHPTVLTALWAASLLLAIWRLRQPAARAVVVAGMGTILGCVVGPLVASSGAFGTRLLGVVQPLRMMALIPVVAAGSSLVALQLYWPTINRLLEQLTHTLRVPSILRSWVPRSCLLLLAVPVAFTLNDSRQASIRRLVAELDGSSSAAPCGRNGPSSAEWQRLRTVLTQLEGGRLWFDDSEDSVLAHCAQNAGLERHTRPGLANSSGVGAHVGVLKSANDFLYPGHQGWAKRAEALGIRYVLLNAPVASNSLESFALIGSFGPLFLYRRAAGSDLFGLGCIREQWSGSNGALESALRTTLRSPTPAADPLDPVRLVALQPTPHGLVRSPIADPCDSAQARLDGENHSVGNHEVSVTTKARTDLVLRVTASPTWHVNVDATPVAPQLVAPGYLAIRIEPGTHRVSAHHGYRNITLFGFGLVLFCPLAPTLRRIWRRFTRRHAN